MTFEAFMPVSALGRRRARSRSVDTPSPLDHLSRRYCYERGGSGLAPAHSLQIRILDLLVKLRGADSISSPEIPRSASNRQLLGRDCGKGGFQCQSNQFRKAIIK
jgi:hypothetical protein